jgi:inosine-uridine nucleoside N-ribohydrolase
MSKSIIIDTDPGTDDAIAILLALCDPSIHILGLTTVGGNAALSKTTTNALRILDYMNRSNIPVIPGANKPLNGRFLYSYDFHGPSGLTIRLPKHTSKPLQETCSDFIAHHIFNNVDPVTIIALGPLTNIALLMQHYPKAMDYIGEVIIMGGAIQTAGNITPHAEFNFYNDPIAADQIMSSGLKITLIDLKATQQVPFTRTHFSHFVHPNKAGGLVVDILRNWFKNHPDQYAYHLHDPLAIAILLDQSITSRRRTSIRVATNNDPLKGSCFEVPGPTSTEITDSVDLTAFFNLFYQLLDN